MNKQSKQVNYARMIKIEFEKERTNRNREFSILDGFVICKGLDRFKRPPGMQWDAWNQLKQAVTRAATCLKNTVFFTWVRVL